MLLYGANETKWRHCKKVSQKILLRQLVRIHAQNNVSHNVDLCVCPVNYILEMYYIATLYVIPMGISCLLSLLFSSFLILSK